MEMKAESGYTTLHQACLKEDIAVVRQHLTSEEINARDEDGQTPLMVACQVGSDVIGDLLLRNRADVNLADVRGRTALHWAALKREQPKLIQLLVRCGADPHVTSADGLTPLHYAAILGFANNARALIVGGASPTRKYGQHTPDELAEIYGHADLARAIRSSE